MPDRFLFRGIRLVDPAGEQDGVTDVLVDDEVIADVGPDLVAGSGTMKMFDAAGTTKYTY